MVNIELKPGDWLHFLTLFHFQKMAGNGLFSLPNFGLSQFLFWGGVTVVPLLPSFP